MNYPRSEYDFGTAAIELAFYTPKPAAPIKLSARAIRHVKIAKIERSHAANPARVRRTSAARWVWENYPHHFGLVVI